LKRCFSSLFSIFERKVSVIANTSGSQRTYTLGGVENCGNTCIFSSLLQDFAALPEAYNIFLNSPSAHEKFRQHFKSAIENIRAGKTVKKEEVVKLASLLRSLGWEGRVVSSLWRRWLHRLLPCIFSPVYFSPYALYEIVFKNLIAISAVSTHQFVFAGKENRKLPFSQYFQSRAEIKNSKDRFIWRVVPKGGSVPHLEENFQEGQQQFTLKIVHVYQKTFSGKHVLVYRKLGNEWVCCNDTKITAVKKLPTKNIYAVVYASQPQSSH
jgi:hypothetical protein